MPIINIEGAADERLTPFRSVADAEFARRTGRFVAEGRLVVERLLTLTRHPVESLLLTPASLSALDPMLRGLPSDVPVFVAAQHLFRAITGHDLHRGCLAIARRPVAVPVAELIASATSVVLIDSVADPDNVGSIFRNARAFDVDAVIVSPTACDPLYRKAIRTSMGATLSVPFSRSVDWPGDIAELRRAGFTVAALTPRGAKTIEAFAVSVSPGVKVALLFGAEGNGLSQEVMAAADTTVAIPISRNVDSLNVAVASGITLSTLYAKRHPA